MPRTVCANTVVRRKGPRIRGNRISFHLNVVRFDVEQQVQRHICLYAVMHDGAGIHVAHEGDDIIKLRGRHKIGLQASHKTWQNRRVIAHAAEGTLFIRMTSADAICFSASIVRGLLNDGPSGRRCCAMCLASTTQRTPSSANRLFAMSGRKKSWMTGAGSARPAATGSVQLRGQRWESRPQHLSTQSRRN
jgi:hypothetical protein